MIAIGLIVAGYVLLVATTGWIGVGVAAAHVVIMLVAGAAQGWIRR